MKNRLKLFCTVLAAAFMLTACGGPKLIGVELPETPLVVATGETATAETSYTYDGETPENAQPEVVYTSGDATIATVDENGVITGVAEGETTITATVGELSASRTVSVIIPVERLEAESMALHLADGPSALAYTVVPENFTGELTFASANNSIATVDANGQITPVAVFRMTPGKEVRLKNAYIVKCTGCTKDAEGNITEIQAEYDTLSIVKPDI